MALAIWGYIGDDDKPEECERVRLGGDIGNGENYNSLVKAGHWQTTTPIGDEFVLVSCVVTPGFEDDDFMLEEKIDKVSQP